MTALLREPLKVYMPAAAVSHVRLVPRWETLAPGILEFVPPLCSTRLPAFVCACGERRLILEWPDGHQEWNSEDGQLLFCRVRRHGLVIESVFRLSRGRVLAFVPSEAEPTTDPEPLVVEDAHGDLRAIVEADTVETLLDYARAGNEPDFRDLAAMSGVPLAQLDELWQGTRARLHQGGAA